ncbi:hypothetical protein F4814DRAFT_460121 [Daldinia grandis]|nr:hypothetical protein F4814DRAFT_460121 [Daldinia grandis]
MSQYSSSTGHNDSGAVSIPSFQEFLGQMLLTIASKIYNNRMDSRDSMPSTLLPCLVILGTAPLSRHTDDNLLKFGKFATDQLEFKIRLVAHPGTYRMLKLGMYRNTKSRKNGKKTTWVAGMDFYFQSISHVSCTRLSQGGTKSYLNRSFDPFNFYQSPIQASSGSLRLSFRFSRALLYYEEIRLVSETEKQQVQQLQEFADSVSADTPREITFLVPEDRCPAEERFPDFSQDVVTIHPSSHFTRESSHLNVFKAISLVSSMVSDPLAPWFARSPVKELINIRTILEEDEENTRQGITNTDRPLIPDIAPLIKFFDDRQFKITQAYGTMDSEDRARIRSGNTAPQEFQCHILVLPQNLDRLGNPSTVAVAVRVHPGSARLLSSATECAIQVLGAKRTKNPPYEVDIFQELPEVLGRIARENIDDPSAINPEVFVNYCNVIKHEEQIGAEKAKAIRTELEDIHSGFWASGRMADVLDLREFVAKHKGHLRMPQVKSKALEYELATWNARAIDTIFPLFGSRFRIFLAKIPLEPYIKPTLVPKTFEQEMEAYGEVQYPASTRRGNVAPSPLALDIYRWLPSLESPKSDSVVNHFAIFPGMVRALDGTAPEHLQSMYNDFDECKKQLFSEHMKHLPCGLAVIPGVAASGMSTFVKFYALMHLAEQPPPGSRNQVLVLAQQHQVLDSYEASFRRSLEGYGAPPHTFPRIERVYTTSTEIRVAVDTLSQPTSVPVPNGLDTIDQHLTESILDEFHQLAEKTSQDSNSGLIDSSIINDAQSRSEEYSSFSFPARHVDKRTDPIKSIYEAKLREANIVLATPSTACGVLFRREFHPTLVIMDQNACMRELTTIMAISSFPSAKLFMLLGDPQQHVPATNYHFGTSQAFDNQISLSCLDRIKRGGAALPGLFYNHRQYGYLQGKPSAWFYDDLMKSGIKGHFPPAVRVVHSMIAKLTGLHKSARIVVDVTNSTEKRVDTSFKNAYHLHYVLKILEFFLNNSAFTSIDGKQPGTIAVISYYEAQAAEIQLALRRREVLESRLYVTGEDIAKRVRVGTVDSFHGEGADLVIIDYTRTKGPGLTGDTHLNATAHTRSIQGEIILMNRSSFARHKNSAKDSLTKNLNMIYNHLEGKGCVLKTTFCERCLGWGHKSGSCKGKMKCSKCYETGHVVSSCVAVKCLYCGELGHPIIECNSSVVPAKACCRCGGDHLQVNCTESPEVYCTDCNNPGHFPGRDLCRTAQRLLQQQQSVLWDDPTEKDNEQDLEDW